MKIEPLISVERFEFLRGSGDAFRSRHKIESNWKNNFYKNNFEVRFYTPNVKAQLNHCLSRHILMFRRNFCLKFNSHAVGMAVAQSLSFDIDFVINSISGSAA